MCAKMCTTVLLHGISGLQLHLLKHVIHLFRFIATNSLLLVSLHPPPGRPGAPKDFAVTSVTENTVTLKWSPPESDGGREITGYIVEKRDPHRRAYTQVGRTGACEFKVTRLVAGNEYVFQVSAENQVGVGEPAELSHGVVAKSPFGEYNKP